MRLFTIGFTQKSARNFFERLRQAGVQRVIDVRLNNNSQLAGFSKKEDLAYFLKEICGIEYTHSPELAPTPELFEAFKKRNGDWNTFERQFLQLMEAREIKKNV